MHSTTPATNLLTVSLLLLATFHSHLQSCACAQISSRFFYDGNNSGAAGGTGLSSSNDSNGGITNVDKKVKLFQQQRMTDPIPMTFYKELDNITDEFEFIERYVDKDTIDPKFGIHENLQRSVERASSVIPKLASCIPERTVVPLTPLEPSNDPKIIYQPKCTRVNRCGGCCNSDVMSCQAVSTETINFQIGKYRIIGGKAILEGKEIIPIEEHTRCTCDCRIKKQDCNSYQDYNLSLCRCICTNDDALNKCFAQEHKFWDEQNCRCVCRENQSCTTGTYFDENQCRCIDPEETVNVTPNTLDRRRFIVKAIPVETNNSQLYSL